MPYPEEVAFLAPDMRFAHPGKATVRPVFTPKGLDSTAQGRASRTLGNDAHWEINQPTRPLPRRGWTNFNPTHTAHHIRGCTTPATGGIPPGTSLSCGALLDWRCRFSAIRRVRG